MTPTRQCAECQRFEYDIHANEAECEKGHKMRFFMPKGPMDFNYGWKRKCDDFIEDLHVIGVDELK